MNIVYLITNFIIQLLKILKEENKILNSIITQKQ